MTPHTPRPCSFLLQEVVWARVCVGWGQEGVGYTLSARYPGRLHTFVHLGNYPGYSRANMYLMLISRCVTSVTSYYDINRCLEAVGLPTPGIRQCSK